MKLETTIHNIFVEVYENSDPKADFNELLKNARINKDGKKEIDFDKYHIDHKVMTDIVEKHVKKLNPYHKHLVYCEVYLGASPRFKDANYYKNQFKINKDETDTRRS